jgi:hypothetical protein
LNLCNQVAVLDHGRLTFMGSCEEGVELYTSMCAAVQSSDVDLLNLPHSGAGSYPLLRRLRFLDGNGQPADQARCGGPVQFELTLDPGGGPDDLHAAIIIEDMLGVRLFTLGTFHAGRPLPRLRGPRKLLCRVDDLSLAPGRYAISLLAGPLHQLRTDMVNHAAWLDVSDGDFYGNGRPPEATRGRFLVRSKWNAEGAA